MTVFLGTLWCSIKKIEAPFVFDWEHGIAMHKMMGIEPLLRPFGMSHGISRVAAGAWGVFLSYREDGQSKLHFVQRSHDPCVVMRDTSGI